MFALRLRHFPEVVSKYRHDDILDFFRHKRKHYRFNRIHEISIFFLSISYSSFVWQKPCDAIIQDHFL